MVPQFEKVVLYLRITFEIILVVLWGDLSRSEPNDEKLYLHGRRRNLIRAAEMLSVTCFGTAKSESNFSFGEDVAESGPVIDWKNIYMSMDRYLQSQSQSQSHNKKKNYPPNLHRIHHLL